MANYEYRQQILLKRQKHKKMQTALEIFPTICAIEESMTEDCGSRKKSASTAAVPLQQLV